MNIFQLYCLIIFTTLFIVINTVHAQIALDGTMGTSGSLDGPDYVITDGMGTTVDTNLFHSFGDFNIYSDESATFTGPSYLENVISRVTGGNSSFIDGLFKSEIDGADFYFLNPAGVMFGENAQLDITGSFHTTTADYLELGEAGRFDATNPENSILTSAPPSAFGFLGDNPSSIEVDGSFLEVSEGETISMIGGDIEIKNGYLYAPGGQINMVSIASEGEVGFDDNIHVFDGFENFGDIDITDERTIANLDTSGEGGGTIYIRGDKFVMDGAYIFNDVYGDEDGGDVDIQLTGDFVGKNASLITTDTFGPGNSGSILIGAENMTLENLSGISSWAYAEGDSGAIILDVNDLTLTGASQISTDARIGSSGKGGDITITATGPVGVSGYYDSGSFAFASSIKSETSGQGDAGSITLNVGSLSLADAGKISTEALSFSSGRGGDITITATGPVDVSGYYDNGSFAFISSISSNTIGVGDAGNITLNVGSLSLAGAGRIASNSLPGSSGRGGDITITATGPVDVSGFYDDGLFVSESSINSKAFGEGNAGDIILNVGSLSLTNAGTISTDTQIGSSGRGGNITITATDSVDISGLFTNTFNLLRSSITSVTAGEGNAGNIILIVGSLSLRNAGSINTGATPYSSGRGGDITITATDSVDISGFYNDGPSVFVSSISSATSEKGDAGNITLSVDSLSLTDLGSISTDAQIGSSGRGGDITITATGPVEISGFYIVEASVFASLISSNTSGEGDAGNITLNVDSLSLIDLGRIATNALPGGSGRGGDITITATGSVDISGFYTDTDGSSVLSSTIISDTLTEGDSGNIQIKTGSLFLGDQGIISTSSAGNGKGGKIDIEATLFDMRSGSLVSAKSTGAGGAGDITINIGDLLYSENSSITTEAEQAAGGNININGNDVQLLYGSEITASVASGEGGGGNVTIDVDTLVALDDSDITARADVGFGGNITINSKASFFSDDIDLDASSNVSGREGSVNINSPVVDISGDLITLPKRFLDVEQLLPAGCETRTGEDESSFVIYGRDRMPVRPEDALPSL